MSSVKPSIGFAKASVLHVDEETKPMGEPRFIVQWPHISGLYAVLDKEKGALVGTFPEEIMARALVLALTYGWVVTPNG
jgi:hypothetical protein